MASIALTVDQPTTTEASQYGICNIVPPVLAPSKKTVIANLNRSLAARSIIPSPNSAPTFTTRGQQIKFCPRKHRPIQKPMCKKGYLKKTSKKVKVDIKTLY
ncbi:hypothetical protein CsSME_00043865 [Camellia sinensis var. sinensis]